MHYITTGTPGLASGRWYLVYFRGLFRSSTVKNVTLRRRVSSLQTSPFKYDPPFILTTLEYSVSSPTSRLCAV